jgi:hypothetical protein
MDLMVDEQRSGTKFSWINRGIIPEYMERLRKTTIKFRFPNFTARNRNERLSDVYSLYLYTGLSNNP